MKKLSITLYAVVVSVLGSAGLMQSVGASQNILQNRYFIKVVNKGPETIYGAVVAVRGNDTISRVFFGAKQASTSKNPELFEVAPNEDYVVSVDKQQGTSRVTTTTKVFASLNSGHIIKIGSKLPPTTAMNVSKKIPQKTGTDCSGTIIFNVTATKKKISMTVDPTEFKCSAFTSTKKKAVAAGKTLGKKADEAWTTTKKKAGDAWKTTKEKAGSAWKKVSGKKGQ